MSHSSELAPATVRRALMADIKRDKKSWLHHGIAALAVSVLGLGVAGSVLVTSAAQNTLETSEPQIIGQIASPAPQPDAALPSAADPSIAAAADRAKIQSLADQRDEELGKAEAQVDQAAKTKAADARQKDLESASAATRDQAKILSRGQTATGGNGTQVVPPKAKEAPGRCRRPGEERRQELRARGGRLPCGGPFRSGGGLVALSHRASTSPLRSEPRSAHPPPVWSPPQVAVPPVAGPATTSPSSTPTAPRR